LPRASASCPWPWRISSSISLRPTSRAWRSARSKAASASRGWPSPELGLAHHAERDGGLTPETDPPAGGSAGRHSRYHGLEPLDALARSSKRSRVIALGERDLGDPAGERLDLERLASSAEPALGQHEAFLEDGARAVGLADLAPGSANVGIGRDESAEVVISDGGAGGELASE
jgi:hypothetical protein